MTSNQNLRKEVIAARNSLPENYRRMASYQICSQVFDRAEFQRAKRIAAYLPMTGEVDPRPLFERAWILEKQIFVPRIVSRDNPLQFLLYNRTTELNSNRWGILEPPTESSPSIDVRELDLVIAPMVAFDEHCHRLGMGAGYYDRTFEFRRQTHDQSPFLIGIAFEAQRVPGFSLKPHDVQMDLIVSELQAYQRS